MLNSYPSLPARKIRSRYPYLIIRLMPAVYGLRSLPPGLTRSQCIARAWEVMEEYDRRRHIWLVWGPEEALFCNPDGTSEVTKETPAGAFWIDTDPPEEGDTSPDGRLRRPSW